MREIGGVVDLAPLTKRYTTPDICVFILQMGKVGHRENLCKPAN